ncbi:hypothetical protein [Gemmata sp. SH-PL17]|uniref:hypothetical protein n=1 Tax=Gemmata sp. SH-PL17 TaxID=1630693 RepID=UPI0012FBC899|nr:hypothetical protein [Gemmata sp. SH-PL17]
MEVADDLRHRLNWRERLFGHPAKLDHELAVWEVVFHFPARFDGGHRFANAAHPAQCGRYPDHSARAAKSSRNPGKFVFASGEVWQRRWKLKHPTREAGGLWRFVGRQEQLLVGCGDFLRPVQHLYDLVELLHEDRFVATFNRSKCSGGNARLLSKIFE